MAFTNKNQPSRRRGRNSRPTKTELDSYYELLRMNAERGDVQAAAALISLAERNDATGVPQPCL